MIRLLITFFMLVLASADEKWFNQKLNHFNYENHEEWRQRYFVSSEYYRPGGPAFLQIGGEGPASPIWLTKGHWIETAKDVGAMLFIVEHRFYGKSHPTNDTSVENLRFLSSEQALADLARFIQNKTAETKIQDWITFGGSYPGSLSLWMKLKYPFLLRGAMSASAPLLAKINFYEYNEVVNRSLTTFGGEECVKALASASNAVQDMLKTDDGRKKLTQEFNLCAPLQKEDDEYFQSTIYDPVAETVQYNRDNRAFEGATGTNVTIDAVCKHMTDKSLGSPIQRYATIPNLFGSHYARKRLLSRRYIFTGKGNCVDASYENFIKDLSNPIFNAERTWTFQTCTEFGWYQTSDSPHQPFKGFSLDLFTDICLKTFGPTFTPMHNMDGIAETNANYGARSVVDVISNAVLFNGGVDPWHAVSFVSKPGTGIATSPTFHEIFVPSSAHCAIMYPDSPDDPPELSAARELSAKYVKSWLK